MGQISYIALAIAAGLTFVTEAAAQSYVQLGQGEPSAQGGATADVPGLALYPGISFVPQLFGELGYDSNPNFASWNAKSSAFERSGANFSVTSVSPAATATVNAGGSAMSYFGTSGVEDPNRFAGYANATATYLVQPGLTVTPSGFYSYDNQWLTKSQTEGAGLEAGYKDALVTSIWRAHFSGFQYLDTAPSSALLSPFSLTSAFNYNRSEASWTGILTNGWRIAPYADLSAARVDYTDQREPQIADRNADDYHAKGGLRIAVSPEISTDLGWRYNTRDTEDKRVASFDSNWFDGSVSWRPSPFFFLTGYAERYIGEPSTQTAVLADVHSYVVKLSYLPVPGVTVTASGGRQLVSDIGSGIDYHTNVADAEIDWGYNSHTQFYTALHYQSYEAIGQHLEYDALRVMAGVRIIPDGQDIFSGESLDSLLHRLPASRGLGDTQITASVGPSWFGLPDIKLVTVVGGPFFDQAVGQTSGDDGSLGGGRFDARFARFAEVALPEGYLVSLATSAFYAGYSGTTRSHCIYSATTDCAIVNIVDVSPTQADNTGPFGNLNVTTKRNVDYYGGEIDARLGGWSAGSSKDGGSGKDLSPFRLGFDVRNLAETSKVTSVDPLVNVPARYNETLNTKYYGFFLGFEGKRPLSEEWVLGLDTTAGIYYASTQYAGRYNGYTPVYGVGYVEETGAVNSSLSKTAFIGSLRLDVNRQFEWGTFGVFGKGEYLSYVPRIVYNNNDEASFLSWGISGNQSGTRIKTDEAINLTSGVTVSVPLN